MSGFYQTARDVLDVRPIGHVGEVFRTSDFQSISVANSDPQARNVQAVTVSTATNGRVYELSIDGVEVSYTADASATKPEISAGLKAAIDAEPGARVTVVDDGVDKLTITGLWPGVAFVLSGLDAQLSAAVVTAADEANPLYPGRVLIQDSEVDAYNGTASAKHPVVADFTAQTVEIEITTGAAASFVAVLEWNGQRYRTAVVPHNTDATSTADDIVSEFEAIAPAFSVGVVNATGTLTFTAEIAGAEFDVWIEANGVAGSAEKVSGPAPSPLSSVKRAILGMAARRLDTEAASIGADQSLPANGGAECVRRGRMVVERASAETWLGGYPMWVSLDAATAGKLHSQAGANRVYIGSDLVNIAQSAANDLGLVRINIGA